MRFPRKHRGPFYCVFLHQFKSPLIFLLLFAAAAAALMGEKTDSIVIVCVVLINAVIGTVQEGRAEGSLAALRKLSVVASRVLRDGHEIMCQPLS